MRSRSWVPTGRSLPWIAILLAAAALLRVIYLLEYRAHSVYWDSLLLDADVYDRWAQRIVGGEWSGGDEVFSLPPLYPYFLALIYKTLGRDYRAVYLVQSLLGLVNITLIYSIGRRAFGGSVALIAVTLAALYGPLLFMESKLMGTTVALALSLSLTRLLLLAGDRQTLAFWSACGFLLGVAALARPETLLFALLAGAWLWATVGGSGDAAAGTRTRRSPWPALLVFAASVALAVLPVALRNGSRTGDWSPSTLISSEGGITFYQSNNARAKGVFVFLTREGFSGHPRAQPREEKTLAEAATGRSMTRSEVSGYWLRKGLSWIRANPGAFLLLELKKLQKYFGSGEYSTEYVFSMEKESVRILRLAGIPFAVITGLAVAGMWIHRRCGLETPVGLLFLLLAGNLLVILAFHVSTRYRMPAVPTWILFAAAGLQGITRDVRSSNALRRRRGWILVGVLLAWFALFHWPWDSSHETQRSFAHYNAGYHYYRQARHEEALAEYDRALAIDDTNWRAYYNRGTVLALLGRREEAIQSFRNALEHNRRLDAARRQIRSLGGTP